ncbi:hypothetical protein [Methylobacterium symbioticum]|uniref:Uncharacterized protein n=1 Tax=Methylobacterium symbioticum TaxID=2584084 RepID=A0A509EFA5_9HYPH|nr:hypothetical protein [Methylobacterium symbioticum]VUD73066.1 hypothetical protein MET9862_03678 [Methylobacterium symbioticum]
MSSLNAQSICSVYVGGSRYLIGPMSAFPVRRDTIRIPPSSTIRTIARESSEVKLLQFRLGDTYSGQIADAEKWLKSQVEQKRVAIIPVDSHVHKPNREAYRDREIRAPGLVGGGSKLIEISSDLKTWPARSKIMEMILRSISYLPKQIQKDLVDFISPTSLSILAGTLTFWAAGHFFGYGEAIDVVLLGVGYALIGYSAIEGVGNLLAGVKGAYLAQDEKQLESAAQTFAQGVSRLGVDAILLFLAKKFSASATAEAEANAIARWQSYISGLELQFDGSKAALWARLGDKGERAASLAKAEGLTTLETVLEKTNFFQRYKIEFGSKHTEVTNKVWQMISEKFASKLSGRVTVYMDQVKLMGGNQPQLGAELLEILDHTKVTSIVFKDVSNPSFSLVWSPADLARYRGQVPPSGRWN